MSEKNHDGGGLGFLDPLVRLFRHHEESTSPESPTATRAEAESFAKLDADFEQVVQRLNEKVEEQRRTRGHSPRGATGTESAEDRLADRARRIAACHQAMREDIVEMHAQLGTGLTEADLEKLPGFIEELEAIAGPANNAHSLLPRARHAIAQKLQVEAGERAVARIVALLERAHLSWPDPTYYRDSATPEEVERSRRRRLGDTRAAFLGDGFNKMAERMVGNVRGWGADYPDRNSPLWKECVLEGVAAGIRAQILKDFVEIVRHNSDSLFAQVEAAIGAEIKALHGVMKDGIRSLDQATQAVASALSVVDDVAPEIAWKLVEAERPDTHDEAVGG